MTERLPADIEALIAAERASPDPTPSVMRSVRAQVAQSVGRASLGQAASGVAMKLVVVALVVAAGAIGYYLLDAPGGRAPTWSASIEPSVELIADEGAIADHEAAVVVPEVVAPKVVAPEVVAPKVVEPQAVAVSVPRPDIARMLTTAWQQLSAGDATRALELVERVAARSPQGPLEEERHALEVAALHALDRRDEARASAQRFVERYPQSIHARLVRRALERRQP